MNATRLRMTKNTLMQALLEPTEIVYQGGLSDFLNQIEIAQNRHTLLQLIDPGIQKT